MRVLIFENHIDKWFENAAVTSWLTNIRKLIEYIETWLENTAVRKPSFWRKRYNCLSPDIKTICSGEMVGKRSCQQTTNIRKPIDYREHC